MGLHRRLIAGSAALFIGALGFLTSAPVSAAVPSSCVVNSTGDELNADTTVGCNSTAGTVTLRSALELFNANPGANSVLFNLPSPSVITLANGELPVNDAGTITITGPGARNLAIDGNAASRVFLINPEGSVTANISGLTIRNGNAGSGGSGGGVDINGNATVTLDKVTITGNVARTGGGIGHYGESLTVTNSTLSSNSITDSGNGCYAGAAMDANGYTVTTTFVNDTVTGNISSDSCTSGGTINMCDTATFTNVTISGNSGPGGALQGTGQCNSTTVKNSILANQTGSTVCGALAPTDLPTDGGSNLDSDNSCGFTTAALINTDPMLAGLANNGGPTDTLALKSGSPAIDAVKNTCPDPSADQRGLSRPQGSACDIGAFEFSALKVTSVTASCGPVAGGGSVTITGSGFLGATSVKFGGVAAQSFTVVSDTQVNAVAPAGQSGQQVDITVTTPAGTSTTGSPDQCTYQVLAVSLPKAGEAPAPTGGTPMGPLLVMSVALLVAAGLASIRAFRL
jgi:hypothetical protein